MLKTCFLKLLLIRHKGSGLSTQACWCRVIFSPVFSHKYPADILYLSPKAIKKAIGHWKQQKKNIKIGWNWQRTLSAKYKVSNDEYRKAHGRQLKKGTNNQDLGHHIKIQSKRKALGNIKDVQWIGNSRNAIKLTANFFLI